MSMFREVNLSGSAASGKLFLHSMPGRFETIQEFAIATNEEDIHRVLCLASGKEIAEKSPDYTLEIENEDFRRRLVHLPVEDFGTPDNMVEFRRIVDDLMAALAAGRNVLVHCAAGVGRTGTVAACLLVGLGFDVTEATRRVRRAGSEPETRGQEAFVRHFARSVRPE